MHDWLVSIQSPHRVSALHHLKPLELPKFSGNAQQFVRWCQTFKRLVDEDRYVSDDYKLARLKEALQGSSAEDIVAQMFDGPGAYAPAWAELEQWYGGEDRHLALQEKAILNHPRIADRDSEALRKFAVKLRNVLMNLDLAGGSYS